MFYLNTIEQLFLLVEQLDQLEVCLPYSRLLAGIPILVVFQNLRWSSNKTSLICIMYIVRSNFYCNTCKYPDEINIAVKQEQMSTFKPLLGQLPHMMNLIGRFSV